MILKVVDETGNRYGRLTVLKRAGSIGGAAAWECQCDCGNITIVRGKDLRNKSHGTRSCGCLISEKNSINEVGNRYEKLVVLQRIGITTDREILWECQCDCGNKIITRGSSLRRGYTKSCGCIKSNGEAAIQKKLDELSISYAREFSFKDFICHTMPYRFDFAIFKNQKLVCLIEFQGRQHTDSSDIWYRPEDDQNKRNYCQNNNIPLYEIFYNENVEQRLIEILQKEGVLIGAG